ncbi:acetyl-CoA carboxylase biotin carboxylase subunit [Noviherbaspirillum soli]|uniref:acetyl-CoA carboxylase biotin carboxylase subunit n=1 Tax=Noviherbaspirillum soli TaxID=1064518 RepID=UPI00188C087C|nr:biotin carboxylase N-terminal domain-containing protein [Noviherbaspirillum soli]
MYRKVVVANRGAVAARVIAALRKLGIASVAVYSEADRNLAYLAMADECHAIGSAAPAASYLNQDALLDVVRRSGADGVHPGYGFLSENAGFAARVIDAGVGFIGPSTRWLEAMGHKTRARALMAAHGMPMGASSGILSGSWEEGLAAARAVGFPVLVKPATGGGGIGMLPAHGEEELAAALERAASLARRSFGNAELYLERLMQRPRHIEFQVLADRHGAVRHLFERDCSVQRRHQKVIEESPAPNIDRGAIMETAGRITGILAALGYDNIGTVETLYDPAAGFSFLEMNTRLQVEHAVTEEVTGVDLVQAQIRLAAGERLDQVLPAGLAPQGHAIEVRVYAEDPKRFLPSPGPLRVFRPPQGEGIRVETGYAEGNTVTPFYDPMLAKVITRGATRRQAIARMREALGMFVIEGVKTNLAFARQVLDDEAFLAGAIHTGLTADVLARR